MTKVKILIVPLIFLLLVSYVGAGKLFARGKPIIVISSAFSKPDEQKYIRDTIIPEFEKKYKVKVRFYILSPEDAFDKLRIQKKAGKVTTDVLIAYVSKFADFAQEGLVSDVSSICKESKGRTYATGFLNLGKIKGTQYFVPLLGDSYLLVANRKSLKYLPKGKDIRNLSWQDLVDWNAQIKKGTGTGKFALPGARGNLLVYIIGCSILSYGGKFPDVASENAMQAWQVFNSLKEYVNPSFSSYKEIVSPLKREETWLGITHSARANQVYLSDTQKYILAPVPYGPAGRGCIIGSYGLAVVKGTPRAKSAKQFIRFITSPEIMSQIAQGTGFTPAVKEALQFIEVNNPQYKVIEESLKIFDSKKVSYIPPARKWGRVKATFEDVYYQMIMGQGRVDKNFLEAKQKVIDEELF